MKYPALVIFQTSQKFYAHRRENPSVLGVLKNATYQWCLDKLPTLNSMGDSNCLWFYYCFTKIRCLKLLLCLFADLILFPKPLILDLCVFVSKSCVCTCQSLFHECLIYWAFQTLVDTLNLASLNLTALSGWLGSTRSKLWLGFETFCLSFATFPFRRYQGLLSHSHHLLWLVCVQVFP